jgi:hypothetical protein
MNCEIQKKSSILKEIIKKSELLKLIIQGNIPFEWDKR